MKTTTTTKTTTIHCITYLSTIYTYICNVRVSEKRKLVFICGRLQIGGWLSA
ncbi:hypothetical protein DOY81_000469 [Sarcophaga bullata]|nr:hypothetical protein DOY81_000469 [Sarcophaga bullata]